MPRTSAALVSIANRLYLIGGRTRRRDESGGFYPVSIGDVDEYLEDCDQWATVGLLRVARHDFGCCPVGGQSVK